MKKAVIIGAGNIGRGLIGMLLSQAGFSVLFADINRAVIDDINRRGEYTVHLLDAEPEDTVVRNISAMSALDPALPGEIAGAELVCTSVGLTALPKAAPAIARGLTLRRKIGNTSPVNVIACENAVKGSTLLKSLVMRELDRQDAEFAERHAGFPDCAVDRIIPPGRDGLPADVVVEKYREWDVERRGFKGVVPEIPGMDVVEDLTAYLERKLFTLNGPNAVTAWYGWLKGYKTINDALEDPEIYGQVWGMMTECGEMLSRRHGFSKTEMERYRDALMARFKNPYIIDDVVRVAREPIRKLSPNDRIIAPMSCAAALGIETPRCYTGVALGLMYDEPRDAQSARLRALVAEKGPEAALEQVCGLDRDCAAAVAILKEYRRLREEYRNA